MNITSEKHSQYALTNVTLWSPGFDGVQRDIVVTNGKIKKIIPSGTEPISERTFDCTNKTLIPLGVDPQVHLRVPGQPEKENADTGIRAAVAGGIGAMLTMPNTKPVIDDEASFELAESELRNAVQKYGVEVLLSVAITKGQKGKEAVDFKRLAKMGAAAYTDDGVGVVSDDLMRAVFAASSDYGIPVLQHAEMPGHGGVLAEGPVQKAMNLKAYDAAAEYDMVERDLRMLREYPSARYHVLHVSSWKTLEMVDQAKQSGLNVTCEASPHHLFFTSDDIVAGNPAFKMNPPLRGARDRSALRAGLRSGLVDFVATDHAPHEAAVKSSNLKTSAYGTTGLETSLRTLLTLVHQGELSMPRLVETFSTVPAKFLGVADRFGEIKVDHTLKGILFSHQNELSPIRTDDLASLSRNNCFLDSHLSGKLLANFNGQTVFNMEQQ